MSLEIDFAEAIEMGDLKAISQKLEELAPHEIAEEIFRLDTVESTVIWRLLPKDVALEVFEELDARTSSRFFLECASKRSATCLSAWTRMTECVCWVRHQPAS